MRAQANFVDLARPFIAEIAFDHVLCENVAFQKELVIGLERIERLFERSGCRRHFSQVFRRQVVAILVSRSARIDAALNSIAAPPSASPRTPNRDYRLGPGRGTRRVLTSGRASTWGCDRQPSDCALSSRDDRRFEARHRPPARVYGWRTNREQRRGVLQEPTDVIKAFLADIGGFVAGKHRGAALPDALVDMAKSLIGATIESFSPVLPIYYAI
jgi:hypothetical protein